MGVALAERIVTRNNANVATDHKHASNTRHSPSRKVIVLSRYAMLGCARGVVSEAELPKGGLGVVQINMTELKLLFYF